ncbi:G protein-coupled glucose receptor regulating Gpa2-domain-containing protein [Lophiotrema nucula]|uniref:G protein-coupled glucose receptor regulating Gpa2-domain-containing protein n=1 Tax=Lophiotrema nucula TaxID=690887 RepID=A0A6A5ZP50_9PLEO|nr:G protein-coupled glucose receptor regulating Gpa2-domain-containing protein [Lophiotrema nucula]
MRDPRSFLDKIRLPGATSSSLVVTLVTTYLNIPRVSSAPSPSPNVSFQIAAPVSNWYNKHRTFYVQVSSAACAAVSTAAAFVAFYWFCRMEKRFRHRLIMLLIYGDMMKASWLMIFAVASIARGTITTRSSICQASGFLVQYGTETSDYAVLVMAAHSALQVFRPSLSSQADGLYPYRHLVFAGALVFPIAMSGLAFVNPGWGYMSQGAFCTLPLRPFWYRLALAWVPRYLIAIIIVGLAAAIYAHVGFAFRTFSNADGKPSISTMQSILSTMDIEEGTLSELQPSEPPEEQAIAEQRASSVDHDILASHRASAAHSSLICMLDTHPETLETGGRSQSLPSSPHSGVPPTSRNDFAKFKSGFPTLPASAVQGSQPDNESRNTSPLSGAPQSQAHKNMMHQRSRIHRQLRLLFIYPLVYILMWLIPFINHCMQYQDRWAAHPLYWISLLSTICITLMGTVDCLTFTLRERPWRHIPNSDGSFFGSFLPWVRRDSNSSISTVRTSEVGRLSGSFSKAKPRAPPLDSITDGTVLAGMPALSISIPRVKSSNRTSRSSDQQKVAKNLARMRLKCEKEDRRIANMEKEAKRTKEQGSRRESIVEVLKEDGTREESVKESGSSNGNEVLT